MTTIRGLTKAAALAALPALLAGCVTLLPKSPPAQLYRFGAAHDAAAAAPARQFSVSVSPIAFDRASANDQMLTVEGDKTAYISGARWVTSATSLFEEAVNQAFDGHAGAARRLAPGENTHADFSLKLDVRRFEARYDHGQGAAPTVTVEVYAALDSLSDPAADKQRLFRSSVPAVENRVGAIVAAYDQAVGSLLGDLTSWVDARGAS